MSDRVIRIEKKTFSSEETEQTLRQALLKVRRSEVTPAEAAAISGLPLEACAEALLRLTARHRARVQVGEAGTLTFRFENLAQEDRLTRWAGWRQATLRFVARHLDTPLAVLVAWAMPIVLLAISLNAMAPAMLLAGPGGSGYGWPMMALAFAGAGFTLVCWGMALVMLLVFLLLPLGAVGLLILGVTTLVSPAENAVRWAFMNLFGGLLEIAIGAVFAYGSWALFGIFVFTKERAWARKMIDAICGFLFGPRIDLEDELSDERRLTSLIVKRHGVIGVVDACELFGWTPDQASQELIRVLVDYGGHLEVSDDGALVYHFASLQQADATAARGVDVRPCWDRLRPPPKFWGCGRFTIGFAALCTTVSLLALWAHPALTWFPAFEGSRDSTTIMLQAFGAWPYLFLWLPVVARIPLRGWQQRKYRARQRYLALLKVAVESPQGQHLAHVNMRDMVRLEGDIDPNRVSDNGQYWVHFPRFAYESKAAERARSATVATQSEPVVFDTHAS